MDGPTLLLVRGFIGVAIGIVAIAWPGITIAVLVSPVRVLRDHRRHHQPDARPQSIQGPVAERVMPHSKTLESPTAMAPETLGTGTEPPRAFEFVAKVAHALRSPLAAILGWLRLLETPLPEHERERVLRIIQRCAINEIAS